MKLLLLALLIINAFSACTWMQYSDPGTAASDPCTLCTVAGKKDATGWATGGTAATAIANCNSCTVAETGTADTDKKATLTCTACGIGYFLKSDGTSCDQCATNCRVCSAAATCTTCSDGYYLTSAGACELCDNSPSSGC